MSEAQANPETGAIEPMNVNEAANAFRGLFESGAAKIEPAPGEQPQQEAAPEAAPEYSDDEPVEIPDDDTGQEAEQTAEAQKAPERYTVKINGQEREVTLDELKSGFSMEADYRQKTAQLAEQRRALEAERQTYKQQLDQLVPQLQKAGQSKWANVNWQELARNDPAQYVALQAEYTAEMHSLAVARAEQQKIEQAQQQEMQKRHREYLAEQEKLLTEKIPALKDAEKAKTVKKAIAEYLQTEGFAPEDVQNLADHRAAVIAWKAMQYDRAVKAKSKATEKVAAAPPVQKPGTARPASSAADKASLAINRLKKTGSVNDAAAAFRAFKIF